jgi:hypothetical protein
MKTHMRLAGIAALAAGILLTVSTALAGIVNRPGNILIADQFNNRVIEIDRQGHIVWSFGLGPQDLSARSILGVNDAERVGRDTLMAGTGIPPGIDPFCTNSNGCPDNRVILVNPQGKIIWQYGKFGVTGSDPGQLNTPVQATYTKRQTIFITDQANERIIEVGRNKRILWQYGMTGVTGSGFNQLNNPNSAELLSNGHVLIADENNNRAIEVDRSKNIVATFTAGHTANGVAFASRLSNGNTLLTDSNNNRIVLVDPKDNLLWQYLTNQQSGSNPNPLPTRAVETMGGQILISDQFNNRVILISQAKNLLAQYGLLNQSGFGTTSTQKGLFAPYDAKVIGDYTGITPPH